MIKISTLTNQEFYLNCELFEKIEANPNTVITMTNGNKYVVQESIEEVLKRINEYKLEISRRFI